MCPSCCSFLLIPKWQSNKVNVQIVGEITAFYSKPCELCLQKLAYNVVNTLRNMYLLKFPHSYQYFLTYKKNKIRSEKFFLLPSKWPPTREFLHFRKLNKNDILWLCNFLKLPLNYLNILSLYIFANFIFPNQLFPLKIRLFPSLIPGIPPCFLLCAQETLFRTGNIWDF